MTVPMFSLIWNFWRTRSKHRQDSKNEPARGVDRFRPWIFTEQKFDESSSKNQAYAPFVPFRFHKSNQRSWQIFRIFGCYFVEDLRNFGLVVFA